MATTQMTSKQYFTFLKIIHLALIAGLFMFGLVTFLLVSGKQQFTAPDFEGIPFNLIIPLFAFALVLVSMFLFKKKLEAMEQQKPLLEKTAAYQIALIMRWALIEAPALLCLVFFLLTADYLLLALAGILVAYMATMHPSKEKAIEEMKLSYEDRKKLENPENIIAEINR